MAEENLDPNPDPNPDPTSDPTPDPAPSNQPEPTIIDDPGPTDSDVPPAWREDWRTALSSRDEDQKTLNRFKSPEGLWKSYDSLRKKVSGGEYTRARPDTDDVDVLKAWRTEVGVPETPEGYLEKLPEGLEVPPEDQPIVDKYLERMHSEGASLKHVHDGLAWYYEAQQQMAEERVAADKTNRARSEDDLRAEWGPEYRGQINGIQAVLESHAGEGLKEEILTARTDDGTILGDHPGFLRFLANVSSDVNPHGVVTPSVGEDRMQNIEQRLAELQKEMADTKSKAGPDSYWSNPAKQEEYRRLSDLEARFKSAT